MPSSSWTNTSGQWSRHRPSPVQRSWSIHTRISIRGYRQRRYPRPVLPDPPVAKRVPTVVPRHTGDVVDDYAWLLDRDDPDTLAYLEAENAYADAWFEPVAPLRDELFDEIKRRTQETDLSVPVPKGPWRYYARTEEGLSYPVHCRRPAGGGDEEVLLDENAQATGHEYFALGAFDVSPGHDLVAW